MYFDVVGMCIIDVVFVVILVIVCIIYFNLVKCMFLSVRGVIDFLINYFVVKEFEFLSLVIDVRSYQFFDVESFNELFFVFFRIFKFFSLKGSKMEFFYVEFFWLLIKYFEEFVIGCFFILVDVNCFFVFDENIEDDVQMQLDWVFYIFKYLDLFDFWGQEFDLVYFFSSGCVIFKNFFELLEVIEVVEDVFKRVKKLVVVVECVGWKMLECGS